MLHIWTLSVIAMDMTITINIQLVGKLWSCSSSMPGPPLKKGFIVQPSTVLQVLDDWQDVRLMGLSHLFSTSCS